MALKNLSSGSSCVTSARRRLAPAFRATGDLTELDFKEEAMAATQDKVLDLIFGRWRSQILYAGVKRGVFEALREGTKDAAIIAQELGFNPNLCYRLLRALGALDLLQEEDGRRFSITKAGRYLLSDHPQTLRGVTLLKASTGR